MAGGFFQTGQQAAIRTVPNAVGVGKRAVKKTEKRVGRASNPHQRCPLAQAQCHTVPMNYFWISAARRAAAFCVLLPTIGAVHAQADGAVALLDKHTALAQPLARNPFGRPLVLESQEANNRVTGHAYAVLGFPFSTVSAQFKNPQQWCEVMILHLNTKYCRASGPAGTETLKVSIGKKTPQALSDASTLSFQFKLAEATPHYMAANLTSRDGPMGTSDYRMTLQAATLPGGKTFVHLSYGYSYGLAGKLAMQSYLSTIGRSKIGFTSVVQKDGREDFVGGMRGTVERNTMRYYLAMEALMVSLQEPAPEQVNKRLDYWFSATEQYPEQLREIERASYMTMKRAELQRQQSAP